MQLLVASPEKNAVSGEGSEPASSGSGYATLRPRRPAGALPVPLNTGAASMARLAMPMGPQPGLSLLIVHSAYIFFRSWVVVHRLHTRHDHSLFQSPTV